MKHVTFTRTMLPQRAGDRRILPDDVAARLEAEGAILPDPPDWPEKPPQRGEPPEIPPDRERGGADQRRDELPRRDRRQTYLTKTERLGRPGGPT
jgi:hypothetical protein